MKKTRIILFLVAGLVTIAVVSRLLGLEEGLSLTCLPFVLCAKGLRALSLSGSTGNIIAIVLLALLGLLPLLLKGKEKWQPRDLLLLLTCGSIWYAEYYLINPGLLPIFLSGSVGQQALCGCVYGLVFSWALLRLLHGTDTMDTPDYLKILKVLLFVCILLCVASVLAGFGDLLNEIRAVREANTMPGVNLVPTYVFLTLSWVVAAIELLFDAFIFSKGNRLLKAWKESPWNQIACNAARDMSLLCRRALAVITLSHTVLYVGQVLFAAKLHSMSVTLRIPLASLAAVFAALVLTGILQKGRALQEDNDLFI